MYKHKFLHLFKKKKKNIKKIGRKFFLFNIFTNKK
jgi:hypothetical protein